MEPEFLRNMSKIAEKMEKKERLIEIAEAKISKAMGKEDLPADADFEGAIEEVRIDLENLALSSHDDFKKLKEYHDRLLKEKAELERKMRVKKARLIMASEAEYTEETKEIEKEIAGLSSEIKEHEKSLQETSPIVAVFDRVWQQVKNTFPKAARIPPYSGYPDTG